MTRGHPRGTSGRPRGTGLPVLALVLCAWVAGPGPLDGQLRPLEPLDWGVFDSDGRLGLGVGVAAYADHAASLAGTRGRLVEVGLFRGTWRSASEAVQLSGTAFRLFRDDTVFASPVGSTRGVDGHHRADVGDQRVSTILRLTDGGGPWDAALRFGVRLPTTDNREGLERDQTDFFATVARG